MKALRDKGVKASALFGTLGKKARNAVMNDLMGRAYTDGAEGPYPAHMWVCAFFWKRQPFADVAGTNF